MIVCKTCGEQNENDARFCANCSSYLEWDGQAVPTGPVPVHMLDRNQPAPTQGGTPPATPSTPTPPAGGGSDTPYTPPPTTVINVPREMLNRPASGLAGDPGAPPPPPAPPPAPPTGPAPGPPAGPPAGYNPYPAGGYPAPQNQPAPGHPAGPQPRMPGAQQPSEPVRRRRRQPTPTPEPGVAPGEIACRVCGTGNTPDRRFCRTCGTAMLQEQAPPPERIGFWRRLFGGRSAREAAEAGTRHRNVRQPIHWVRPVVILAVIAGLLFVGLGPARPYIVKGIDLARDRFATKVVVNPQGWKQSSSYASPATALGDKNGATFWAPGKKAPNGGIGSWFEASFSPAIGRLTSIQVLNGISANPPDYAANRRPSVLNCTLTNAAGDTFTSSVDLTLDDVPGAKEYTSVNGNNVTDVKCVIKAAYQGDATKPLAINEVTFFEDKSRKVTIGK
ncbi:NADase-type glycan-binding domain-containing protein [Fodinicola acaciae]|uniref:NADase-type glycan-binding domain-containing protein n=1 Tax=Fodinicola acaciae TaxID=2681555 RepID=UPI0013D6DF50|nr:zinc ribbon domain-containing protein [Fodinicola acaciae]